jgi:WD40 repeat protein
LTAVFISHSNAGPDRREASALRDVLVEGGYENVFLDLTGLRAMGDWESQLHRQLAVADVVVFLHSTASANSSWCQTEIGIARFRHRPVLVVPVESIGRFASLGTLQQLRFQPDRERRYAEALTALLQSGYGPETSYGWDIEASPYPGLAPFEADRAAVFFGREQDVRDLETSLNPARTDGAVVVVAGASGTGKSSLIRAGLLPRLRRRPEWSVLDVLEPGPDFHGQLRRTLACLKEQASSPDDAVIGAKRPAPILVVDQAERLLVGDDPALPGIAALKDLADALSTQPGLHLILVTKAVETRLVAPIADWLIARHLVVGLSRTQLARVVAQPAVRAGMTVDPALVSRLVEATPSGEALPLLALTLSEMWRRRSSADSLTLDDYERVGGVTRILTDVTQSVLRTLPRIPHDDVVATMLAFVSVDHTGQAISVPRSLESFVGTQRRIVDAFADRRLVTVKQATDATAHSTVALTHDALMTSWGSLAAAIEREREQLVLENDVRREAQRGEQDWTLLTGPRLDAALSRFEDREVEELVARYLAACRQARADAVAAQKRTAQLTVQRRRRTALAAAGIGIALVALAAVVLLQRQNTQITALEQSARAVSLSDTRRDLALTNALSAIEHAPSPAAYSALLQVLTDQPGPRRYLAAPGSGVRDVTWTHGAGLLIRSAARVERLDEQTGKRTLVAAQPASAVAASQDGSVTVALDSDGLAIMAADGTRPVTKPGSQPLLSLLAMDRDASRIAVADPTPAIRLYDRHNQRWTLLSTQQVPTDMAMSADGRMLAVVDGKDGLTLWDLDSGSKTPFTAQSAELIQVAIAADGRTMVVVSDSGVVERMRTAQPSDSEQLTARGEASTAAFLDDGVLAVGRTDGTIALFDPLTDKQLATFGSHRSALDSITGTSAHLVSSADGEVIVWDGPNAVPLLGQVLGEGYNDADVGDDGTVAAVRNEADGTVRVSEWPTTGQRLVSKPLGQNPTAVAAGAAGQLALVTDRGTVQILNRALEPGADVSIPDQSAVSLDWVGDRLAVGTAAGQIVLLRDGHLESQSRVTTSGSVTHLRAMPDADIAWGTSDGVVGIWPATTTGAAQVLGRYKDGGVTALEYGAKEATLYAGGEDHQQTMAWRLGERSSPSCKTPICAASRPTQRPTHPTTVGSHTDDIVGLASFSTARETWLATASQDRTIEVLDMQTGTRIGPAIVAPGGARFMQVQSGDGTRFITLDSTGRVIAWDLSPSGLIRTACKALLPRPSGGIRPPNCTP